MPCANTLGETPNPPPADPPAAQPGAAVKAPLTPVEVLQVQAALIRLVTLAVVLTILQAFGFRIRRERAPRAKPTPRQQASQAAPTQAVSPKPPARPRPVYRYLERESWVALLDNIAHDMAPMAPMAPMPSMGPEAPVSQAPPTPRPTQSGRRQDVGGKQRLRPQPIPVPCPRPGAHPAHPPPRTAAPARAIAPKKPESPPLSNQAYFVTI